MNRVLVFLFLFVPVAFAQLVPPDMALLSAEADSSDAPVPYVELETTKSMVEVPEGQPQNWNGYKPADPDSLRYYDVEIFRNQQEATHKHSIANVLKVIALSGGLLGLGFYGSSYFINDDGRRDVFRYVGEGILVGSLVSAGFAYGFDLSSEGFRIKAQYYIQKLADYQKRHSALETE